MSEIEEIKSTTEIGESSAAGAARGLTRTRTRNTNNSPPGNRGPVLVRTQTGAGNTNDNPPGNRGPILLRTQTGAGDTQNNPTYFSFSELQDATRNFDRELRIKKGRTADIFRGTLKIGEVVAVKRLKSPSTARNAYYDREIKIHYRVGHPNIIKLFGSCAHEDERIIVYEFMPIKTLHDHLNDRRSGHELDWKTRMNIAAGIARGLNYLHSDANQLVSCCDLNATSLLLDDNFQPKLSEIGIDNYHLESDLYRFGLLLLEIITGRKQIEYFRLKKFISAEKLVKVILATGTEVYAADRKMRRRFPLYKLKKALTLVLYCVHVSQVVVVTSKPYKLVESAMNYLTSTNPSEPWSLYFPDVVRYHPTGPSLGEIREAVFKLHDGERDQRGSVFKGKLNKEVVAMKWFHNKSMVFEMNIQMHSKLRHSNIINLVGYCSKGAEHVLVYEFMRRGSLYDVLHGDKTFTWDKRMKAAHGIAKAISYLHYEARTPVIYGDLKSSNILLDEKFNPRICHFGSAQSSVGVIGTSPYWSPERAFFGRPSFKSDVYNFGMILLEIITGHVPLNMARRESEFLDLVDPELVQILDVDKVRKALKVASMCVSHPSLRPDMLTVERAMNHLTSDRRIAWPHEFAMRRQLDALAHGKFVARNIYFS